MKVEIDYNGATRIEKQQLNETFAEGVEQATECALQYIAEHYLSECSVATAHAALTDCERFILKTVEPKKFLEKKSKKIF
jgi:hypothetical protein